MRDGRRGVWGGGFSFSGVSVNASLGCRSFLVVGVGFPKIAIAEGDCLNETNACDAPLLKLMYRMIRVATNGILYVFSRSASPSSSGDCPIPCCAHVANTVMIRS